MTDETTTQSAVESNIVDSVDAQPQPASDGINISVEQILAAIININLFNGLFYQFKFK